jgi:hypothetical protein
MIWPMVIGRKLEAIDMKIFGDYIESEDGEEYLVVHFSPGSVPLKRRWRNNGLSADFLAEYWATFFPEGDGTPSADRKSEIKEAIRYIANELLENVMKFSYESTGHPVTLALYLFRDEFRFYASNAVDPGEVEAFQQRIRLLLESDVHELYVQQVERNVTSARGESNLGLLTIVHDYDARLAWRFETLSGDGGETIVVTTMVRLAL